MSNARQTPLLLTHSRILELRIQKNDYIIEAFPQWLAATQGKDADYFCGQAASQSLFEIIPGIEELLQRTNETGNSIKGYKTILLDNEGNRHQLLLDTALNIISEQKKLIQIIIQEIPFNLLSKKALSQATFCGLIGVSQSMQRVFNKIRLYAASNAPVLVTGETGAGKEGVAAAIHRLSKRQSGPFVTMNCSAITETLFESELFGHERGSFTGAIKNHRGRFERADGGTLFLDEIGDLPQTSQAKLLRVLETSEIEKVGAEKSVKVDVRLVAATNHNLEINSLDNSFRADLFYRINALQIHIPPLRQRTDDLEPLIMHFIQLLNKKYERHIVCLTNEALQLLKQYRWPGNIRELRNLMERLFAENQTDVIGLRALKEWYEERQAFLRQAAASNDNYSEVRALPYSQAIPLGMNSRQDESIITAEFSHNTSDPAKHASPGKEIGAEDLRHAYKIADGNITKASELLGIHKATFYRYLKNLNLTRQALESRD